MKPRLPKILEDELPADVLHYMYQFVPHMKKVKTPQTSPQLEKDLRKIQSTVLKGKNAMYLKDLDDFVLD